MKIDAECFYCEPCLHHLYLCGVPVALPIIYRQFAFAQMASTCINQCLLQKRTCMVQSRNSLLASYSRGASF